MLRQLLISSSTGGQKSECLCSPTLLHIRPFPKLCWRPRLRFRFLLVSLLALLLSIGIGNPVWGQLQTPDLLDLKQIERVLSSRGMNQLRTRAIRLDGRELFQIGLVSNGSQEDNTILAKRAELIETSLYQIAQNLDHPQSTQVQAKQRDNQWVITIADQYLMTITLDDSQAQGYDNPELWANQLTSVIRQALIQFHQERQPEYLTQRALIGFGILLVVTILSWRLRLLQTRFKEHRKALKEQVAARKPTNAENLSEQDEVEVTTALREQQVSVQQLTLADIRKRFLQLTQFCLWAGSLFWILGLFPYTRPLQPIVLEKPLQLLIIGVVAYMADKAFDVMLDHLVNALQGGDFITPEASHRSALRLSTFSTVSKSITTIICAVLTIVAALSVLGVDLVPLLAGAGIVGLAISLASQNLIKDFINGFFILIEDQYAVGDVVVIDGIGGFVENMNLRITQLRNEEGRLITIPNGTVSIVENLTKDWSRVNFTLKFAYNTNPEQALELLHRVTRDLYTDLDWQDKFPEPPEVLGIDDIDHTGLLIRVWIKTKPANQWVVAREFRRRLKLALDETGLDVGAPQQFIWLKTSHAANSLDSVRDHLGLEGGHGL